MDLRLVYLILFFLSVIELVIFYEITSNKINKTFLLLFITTIISNFGYSMTTYSVGIEAAMCGDLISYIGSIFTIYFMLIIVIDMCNTRFYFPLKLILFLSAMAIAVLVSTTRHTNLFFKNPLKLVVLLNFTVSSNNVYVETLCRHLFFFQLHCTACGTLLAGF